MSERAHGHDEVHGRVPPHDIEAEKAVLSAILLDNDAIHSVVTEVREEDFYHPSHQILYRSMVRLRDENQPVDLTTLAAFLKGEGILDSVGGAVALAEIADYEATPANIIHYAKIVRDRSIKRSLISTASEIVALGYEHGEPADSLLDEAESRIFGLSTEKASTSLSSISVEMHDAVNHIDMLMNRSGELTGLSTGYEKLDEMTGGMQPGDLFILAARPSMGKTAFALNVGAQCRRRLRQEGRGLLARDDDPLAGDAHALLRGAGRLRAVSQRLDLDRIAFAPDGRSGPARRGGDLDR